MAHFNTGPGLPQTKAEVEALTGEGLDDFMAFCEVEPADFAGCLACYAYKVAQDREDRKSDSARVPMNIRPEVLERLQKLLFRPELTGVGYSAFLTAAMDSYERGEWIDTEFSR